VITHNNITKNLSAPWWYLLVGDTLGLITLGFYWYYYSSLSIPQFVSAALLLWMTTALAAAPLIRFVLFDWEARYHEFLNRLNNESLTAYLQQFWEKRTTQNTAFVGWESENSEKTYQINTSMEKIFDEIYHEQYGRIAFIAPMVLLNSAIFILTTLCIVIYSEQTILSLNIDTTVAISAIAGAYLYVVSDMVQSVRQRSLNASTIYWYVLRMLLAIPIGIALTYPLHSVVKPLVAFGLGTLPMDQIIKLLRRLTSKQLNLSEAAEESDQLIKLEGVTVRISSMLIAEGVDSIEQLITVDPVLLSIRTGLPFKFILHLGSQAIVRRHLGEIAAKLIPLSLANAKSIAALVTDLDDDKNTAAQNRANAVLVAATSLITPTPVDATTTSSYSKECLEFNFRQIADENYTKFILGKLLTLK
jgi:hypothetical protein